MVIRCADADCGFQIFGPPRLDFSDGLFNQCCRINEVKALAFNDLEGNCIFAVVARGRFPIFKSETNFCQIAEGHYTVAVCFYGQAVDILWLVK